MVGVIDIGSNTVKVSFFRKNDDGRYIPHLKQSTRVGLLRYREKDRLNREGISLLIKTLSEYTALANAVGCTRLSALATAGLRGITNVDEVKTAVGKAVDIDIKILSGEEEAKLGFMGLCFAVGKPEDGLLIDMGGASTEVTLIHGGIDTMRVSLPFGALYLFDRYVAGDLPSPCESDAISAWVRETINRELRHFPLDLPHVYLTGGTAKAISSILLPLTEIGHHAVYGADSFDQLLNAFISAEPGFLHRAVVSLGDRYHLTPPALIALTELYRRFHVSRIIPVDAGIREGQLYAIENGITI